MNLEPQRTEEGMLSLFHEPIEVGEMHDPSKIGFEEFNAMSGSKFGDHSANLANRGGGINWHCHKLKRLQTGLLRRNRSDP